MAYQTTRGRPLDRRVRLALDLAGRATEPGVPSLLWGMASQEDVVATLVLLHHKLLRAAASDLKPTGTLQLEYLGELMVAPYFAETCRQHLGTLQVAESLSKEDLPRDPPLLSDGPFGRQGCWGPVTRIKSALRGALYGAPLAAVTSQSDALKQELVAAALLAAESSDALVMHLLMQEADQVAAGPPMQVLGACTAIFSSISTCIYWVMSGPRRTLAARALGTVAHILGFFIAPIPLGCCDLQRLEQRYMGTIYSSSEPHVSSSSGGSSSSSSSSKSTDRRHSREPPNRLSPAEWAQISAIAQQSPQYVADELRKMAIGHRGLASRLFTACFRAVHLCKLYNEDLTNLGHDWAKVMTTKCAFWLTVALQRPKPITDPCPTLHVPQHYNQGVAWVPDTYSVGPAPAALAGASAISCFAAAASANRQPVAAHGALGCLQLMTAMTKLGLAIMSEAADSTFDRSIQEPAAVLSWVNTTRAMCQAARAQLGTHLTAEKLSSQTHQQLDPAVLDLTPVLNAAALQLAHTALGCARLMQTQVLKPSTATRAVDMDAGAAHPISAAVDVSEALTECMRLYLQLVNTAASLQAASSTTPGSLHSLAPPEFSRHCVAVAVWGNNLRLAWGCAVMNVPLIGIHGPRGSAPSLASWLPDSAEDTALEVLRFAIGTTQLGLGLHVHADHDLAGWLGELAPRPDMTPLQLLYRLSGVYKAYAQLDLEAHGLCTGKIQLWLREVGIVQGRLLPLLAWVTETVPLPVPSVAPDAQPSTSSSHAVSNAGCGHQGRTREGKGSAGDVNTSSSSSTTTTTSTSTSNGDSRLPPQLGSSQQNTASATHATAAQQELVAALAHSPLTLADVVSHPVASQHFICTWKRMYMHIHERLQALSGLENAAFPIQQALSHLDSVLHGNQQEMYHKMLHNTTTSLEMEPLEALIHDKQGPVWEEAWAEQYSPRGQALHARLLDEYVRAAAERAAQQQPSLAEGLKDFMEQS